VDQVRVVFLGLQLAVLVQIQFFPLSPLLAAAVVELKTAMALLAAQVAVVVEVQLLVVAELLIKDLVEGMAHLVGQ
jgi:hypothetical protein